MNITVIGCWGGYPKVNEASSGYLLEEEGFKLLVDCGSGVLSKLQNHIRPQELDAVVLSHYHADHIADIGVLQHARLIAKFSGEDVPVLPIYSHANDQGFAKLTYKDITVGQAYDEDKILEVGPFTIRFMRTAHPAECYAMKITANGHTVVYTGDTSFREEFVPFIQGSEVLLSECNFYSGMDGKSAGHMTSSEAGKLAQLGQINMLILTHLPHFGELKKLKEEAEAEFYGTVILAKQDLEIGI